MRGDRAVITLAGRQAIVATAAVGFRKGLAEVFEQRGPSAGRDFRVAHHLLQLLAGDALFLRVGLFLDELRLLDHVAGAEQQQTFARQPVASGAARLLVVALDVLRQIVMNHESDIRFVDAHAERNGGANHADFIAQKQFLVAGAVVGLQAGVIRRGLHAIGVQPRGDALGRLAALAVNDPAHLRARADE